MRSVNVLIRAPHTSLSSLVCSLRRLKRFQAIRLIVEIKTDTMKNRSENTVQQQKGKTTNQHELSGLRDLFEDQLKGIYWSEKTLTGTFPKMIKNTATPELAETLKQQLDIKKQHVRRCEEIFSSMNMNAEPKKNEAMQGLLNEANAILGTSVSGGVRDAGIISSVQKVKHYEIAAYGTLAAFARELGENEVVSLLEEVLAEEKVADALLSEVAEKTVNKAAAETPNRSDNSHP